MVVVLKLRDKLKKEVSTASIGTQKTAVTRYKFSACFDLLQERGQTETKYFYEMDNCFLELSFHSPSACDSRL